MLRNSFLVGTASLLCVSIASAAWKINPANAGHFPSQAKPWALIPGRNGALARTPAASGSSALLDNNGWLDKSKVTFSNLSNDKNAEFISWYGYGMKYSTVSYYFSSHSWIRENTSAYNAAPFTGAGRKVTRIGAPVGESINLGIYSETQSGLPGRELAGGSTTSSGTDPCCQGINWVKVDITLNAGQEYFFAARCASSPCLGSWAMEDTDFSGERRITPGSPIPNATIPIIAAAPNASPVRQSGVYRPTIPRWVRLS